MTYIDVASFAQSWGLIYFMLIFLAVCVYALWPSNKDKFDHAANLPFDDEDA